MAINISSLSPFSFGAHVSAIGIPSTALTTTGGLVTVAPDPTGFSVFDNWSGNPAPTDTTFVNISVADAARGVIQYTFTSANGLTGAAKVGAQVIDFNSTGILAEQIVGYVPGLTTFTLNPNYFLVFSKSTLDTTVGTGPSAATLTFGTTGSLPTFGGGVAVPEPTGLALLPIMIAALIVARMPTVRALLMGAR